MVNVQIVGIRVDPETGSSAILLGEGLEPTRVLPIMVGRAETQAIVAALMGLMPPRPGTHDLTLILLEAIGSQLEEVAVTSLDDGVFFAELFLEAPSGLKRISARPSDAIALALRAGVPIVVSEPLLDIAAIDVVRTSGVALDDEEIERIVGEFETLLSTATASDFEVDVHADADADVSAGPSPLVWPPPKSHDEERAQAGHTPTEKSGEHDMTSDADLEPSSDVPTFGGGEASIAAFTNDEPIVISAETTLRDAALMLDTEGVGLLVVGTSTWVDGVVSERDIVRAVAAGVDLDATVVADVESTDLKWATPESTVAQVAEEMMSTYVRHVLVGDAGSLVGVVSMRDLLAAFLN